MEIKKRLNFNEIELNDLYDYENRYIYQYSDGFKFSLDSILLAEYVDNLKDTSRILDLCSGNSAIPLILTTRANCKIDAVEIQEEIYDLAIKSIKYNNLEHNITVFNQNINEFNIDKIYDIVTCNPPFFKTNEESLRNNNEILRIARHEEKMVLEDIFRISYKYLKDGGYLYLVHRSSRLDELINLGFKYKIPIKRVQLIKTGENKKPTMVLIKAKKNAKSGLIINDILNIANFTTYKNIFKEK